MTNLPIEATYPVSFRAHDAETLGNLLAQRRSVVIVGMKRVGISNFLRFFLSHKEVATKYLNGEKHLFIPVDLNDLVEREISPFWILTFKRIVDVVTQEISDEVVKKKISQLFLDAIQTQDILITIDGIKKSIETVIDLGYTPTIFFIRFDRIIDGATQEFYSNLQGLLDSSHRKLAYVFTCSRPLETLAPEIFTKQSLSIFADTIYLKPAQKKDVQIILDAFLTQYKLNLSDSIRDELLKSVDGYNQYLQFALIILRENEGKTEESGVFNLLLSDERLGLQSEELWESLRDNEKNVLEKIVQEKNVSEQELSESDYLLSSGMITTEKSLFSPIFENYVTAKIEKKDTPLPELSKKEHLLLTFLEGKKGQICEREAIIEHVWPEAEEVGVSDWAIDRLVSRLRTKLKQQNYSGEIITVKTRGYKFT